jgi:hypothetical protein
MNTLAFEIKEVMGGKLEIYGVLYLASMELIFKGEIEPLE